MTILAIVAGGTWTVWTFFIQRTDVENVSLGVTTDSVEYRGDLRLLVIHVKPKNIGKVLVDPPIFRLTVRRIPLDLPQWKAIDLTPIEPVSAMAPWCSPKRCGPSNSAQFAEQRVYVVTIPPPAEFAGVIGSGRFLRKWHKTIRNR